MGELSQAALWQLPQTIQKEGAGLWYPGPSGSLTSHSRIMFLLILLMTSQGTRWFSMECRRTVLIATEWPSSYFCSLSALS